MGPDVSGVVRPASHRGGEHARGAPQRGACVLASRRRGACILPLLVAGGVFVACANGALPGLNVHDPRNPSAAEAPGTGSVVASAASSSGPALVHHHTHEQPDAAAP